MLLSLLMQDCTSSRYISEFRKQGAACGVWIEEYEMAHVPQNLCTGPWFHTIGIGSPSGQWLLPEETLFMVSAGRMELLDEDGLEMGLLGTWGACIEGAGGVNTYLVPASIVHLFNGRYILSCEELGIMFSDRVI
jgi:tRNA-splicing endonuclease subunit sen54 N-term